jgi:hypothetical protein
MARTMPRDPNTTPNPPFRDQPDPGEPATPKLRPISGAPKDAPIPQMPADRPWPDPDHSAPGPENANALDDTTPYLPIQDIIARGAAGMVRAGAGSKEALTGYGEAALALLDARRWQGASGNYLTPDQYRAVAAQMGIRNDTDARDLPRMGTKWGEVLVWIHAEEIKAAAKGEKPSKIYAWRTAWRAVDPAQRRAKSKRKPPPTEPMTPEETARVATIESNLLAEQLAKVKKEVESERKAHSEAVGRVKDLEAQLADLSDDDKKIADLESKVQAFEAGPEAPAIARIAHLEADNANLALVNARLKERVRELQAQLGIEPETAPLALVPPAAKTVPEPTTILFGVKRSGKAAFNAPGVRAWAVVNHNESGQRTLETYESLDEAIRYLHEFPNHRYFKNEDECGYEYFTEAEVFDVMAEPSDGTLRRNINRTLGQLKSRKRKPRGSSLSPEEDEIVRGRVRR